MMLACVTQVMDGIPVRTDTASVKSAQREALKKILAHHPCACLTCWRRERCGPYDVCLRSVSVTNRCVTCARLGTCELRKLADYFDLVADDVPYTLRKLPVYGDNPALDGTTTCASAADRCARVCKEVRGVEAIKMVEFDGQRIPQTYGPTLLESDCVLCGACVEVCPTGALMDKTSKFNKKFVKAKCDQPLQLQLPVRDRCSSVRESYS